MRPGDVIYLRLNDRNGPKLLQQGEGFWEGFWVEWGDSSGGVYMERATPREVALYLELHRIRTQLTSTRRRLREATK